jgi:hypothetical protein
LRCTYTALVALLLVCIAGGAWAQGLGESIWEQPGGEVSPAAAWFGNTGLMAVPSAQVRPALTAQVSYHWIHDASEIEGNSQNLQVFSADAMATGDLEVGVTRFRDVATVELQDSTPVAGFTDKTTINGRYHLDISRWTSNPEAPDVAIGVRDISDEINRSLYVVVSKGLHVRQQQGPFDVTATLGYGNSKQSGGLLDGIFGGIDFSPGQAFRVQAEYDAQEWNACVRFYPTRTLSLDFGTFNSNLGIGATYESSW